MTGRRGAPWSTQAQFLAVPAALPVLPDEDCHLMPTDSRRFATALRPPDVTLKLSADAEGEPHFAEARCAPRPAFTEFQPNGHVSVTTQWPSGNYAWPTESPADDQLRCLSTLDPSTRPGGHMC